MQASKKSTTLSKKPIPPKVLPRPKSLCRTQDPSERPASVPKYSEQSSPMRFSEAVEYFNSSPASVFLVNDGTYHTKGSEGVKKGECVLPLWTVCAEDCVRLIRGGALSLPYALQLWDSDSVPPRRDLSTKALCVSNSEVVCRPLLEARQFLAL